MRSSTQNLFQKIFSTLMGLICKEATVWLMMPSYNSWPKNCLKNIFCYQRSSTVSLIKIFRNEGAAWYNSSSFQQSCYPLCMPVFFLLFTCTWIKSKPLNTKSVFSTFFPFLQWDHTNRTATQRTTSLPGSSRNEVAQKNSQDRSLSMSNWF